ncbi:hypothetical protein KX729_16500 [Rhizobium sp. XQZ8]|uniref:hypothetical protein n=1 Tax=Rhizobium populisoli TaxID=2859785 RepID=UPI001CA4D6B9|nr:hypothetical protein [Rhizobium populisoli]MBW6423060.1 hypothetical protein [Rhizobium populisoli]
MGAFYVNCCVRGAISQEILDFLRRHDRSGYVGPTENGWAAFVASDLEKQNDRITTSYGEAITHDTDRIAVVFLCHDEDLLKITLFARGKKLGEFDSNPAYFYDHGEFNPDTMTFSNPPPSEEQSKPKLDGADEFARFFELDGDVIEQLSTPNLIEGAIELHARWAEAIGVPAYSVGMGFRYVERAESDVEWTRR